MLTVIVCIHEEGYLSLQVPRLHFGLHLFQLFHYLPGLVVLSRGAVLSNARLVLLHQVSLAPLPVLQNELLQESKFSQEQLLLLGGGLV